MATAPDPSLETLTHRLILPRDANHYGTLYAGVLMTLALEAAYASAFRAAGQNPKLVLKRVLDIRCFEPVPIGRVVEVRSREIYRARAHVVTGLYGSPLDPGRGIPWLDGALQFVQVDDSGRPEPLDGEPDLIDAELEAPWAALRNRVRRLLSVRT